MRNRRIGPYDVSAVGLGAAHLSLDGHPEDRTAIQTIHSAIDAGVSFIDTARVYTTVDHPSHNEDLVRRALASHPRGANVLIGTKGGHYRASEREFVFDGRPSTLRSHVDHSLRTLSVDRLPLYFFHHPDAAVPFTESVGALAELRSEGKIELIGVSNVNLDQVRSAQAVTRIDAVQNSLSLLDQTHRGLARLLNDDRIAFLAHSPLGGPGRSGTLPSRLERIGALASARAVSAQQLAIAWVLAVSPNVVAIPGARRPSSIIDSAAASELVLSESELLELEGIAHPESL